MANRFEPGGPGFLDLAVERLKRPKMYSDGIRLTVASGWGLGQAAFLAA